MVEGISLAVRARLLHDFAIRPLAGSKVHRHSVVAMLLSPAQTATRCFE
jgi:hypothetical protein